MDPTLRSTRRSARQSAVRRRRIAVGCVAALVAAGTGWALAAGSGSSDPAPAAPNSGSAVKGAGNTPQREVSVQPALAPPGVDARRP
jgi:hypothetical protein